MALNLKENFMQKYKSCLITDHRPGNNRIVIVGGGLMAIFMEMEGVRQLSLCCTEVEFVYALNCP